MRRTDQHTFFFTERDVFSNWYRSTFTCWGQTFNCVEQAMMWAKAITFNDTETAAKILRTPHPKTQKALGREVKGYVDAVWDAKRVQVVEEAAYAKFTQNPSARVALLATAGTVLVEASPFDRLWGVGLGQDDPRIDDRWQWRGANKLGYALTRLRVRLVAELTPDSPTPAEKPRRFVRRGG